VTFQVVLSTDGTASFAIFIYENITAIGDIVSHHMGSIGFDAGDQNRGVTLKNLDYIDSINVFRIDGK